MGAILHAAFAAARPASDAQAAAIDQRCTPGPVLDGNSTCHLPFGDGIALVAYTSHYGVASVQGAWIGADSEVWAEDYEFSTATLTRWRTAIEAELQRDADDFRAAQLEGGQL